MKITLPLLGGLLALLIQFPASAADGKAQLDRFFSGLNTLQANFKQTVYSARLEPTQTAEGVFKMSRPGKFRWDYQLPYEQLIVADGKKLWIYDVDLEQVTVKSLDSALGNTPALILSNPEGLSKSFDIEEAGQEEGVTWLELREKKKQELTFKHLRLGFVAAGLQIMELVDSFGQLTRLEFSSVRRNVRLNSDEFSFTPPQGVDVVGEE